MKKIDIKRLFLSFKKLFTGAFKGSRKLRQSISPPSTEGLTRTLSRYFNPIKEKVIEKTTIFRLPERLVKESRTSKLIKTLKSIAVKLSLNDINKKVFDPGSRPLIHRAFLVAVVCSVAYMGGRTAVLSLSSQIGGSSGRMAFIPSPVNPSDISSIETVDLFKAEGQLSKVPIKAVGEEEACVEAQQRSNLPIKLVNAIVLMDSVKSLASVQVRNGKDLMAFGRATTSRPWPNSIGSRARELSSKTLAMGSVNISRGPHLKRVAPPNPSRYSVLPRAIRSCKSRATAISSTWAIALR